jgi:hypothetical protein
VECGEEAYSRRSYSSYTWEASNAPPTGSGLSIKILDWLTFTGTENTRMDIQATKVRTTFVRPVPLGVDLAETGRRSGKHRDRVASVPQRVH